MPAIGSSVVTPPAWIHGAWQRSMVFSAAGRVSVAAFGERMTHAAAALPAGRFAINLCEDRLAFLLGYCAALARGQTTLLPPSRMPAVVDEVAARYDGSYRLDDDSAALQDPIAGSQGETSAQNRPCSTSPIDANALAAIGFTSGSTGVPKANDKRWGDFVASSARNIGLLLSLTGPAGGDVVATVPPQHMYGMEFSVLLPLLGPFAVHAGRPFFPADVARALAEAQAPRLLVTTPVHLHALLQSAVDLPALAGIVLATAPLSQELAAAAEQRYAAPVQEVFGSTETCVIAHRRTAIQSLWQAWADVELQTQTDGTLVSAPWLRQPVLLQDLLQRWPGNRFELTGRNADLLEIAGKRASLGDLSRRLQALPGVQDAVVFQTDEVGAFGIRRIVALAVAPGRDANSLLAELRHAVDPVFLPRPLKCVSCLPRNATGKLPRAELLQLLGE